MMLKTLFFLSNKEFFLSLGANNPQVQGIDATPLNVEVLGIKPHEQEGKSIYSLKLECHNSSYLCTAQNNETSENDLMIQSKKLVKQGK
jgi:hypothetical protein